MDLIEIQAGQGIAKTNYVWPTIVFAPRFGFAYDVTGKQSWVIRGGGGLFYDRPDGNTVFSSPGNPPIATTKDLRNGLLSTLGQGLSPCPSVVNSPLRRSLVVAIGGLPGVENTVFPSGRS